MRWNCKELLYSEHRVVASLCHFYNFFHSNRSDELLSLVHRQHEFKHATSLASPSHPFTAETDKYSLLFYSISFMARIFPLWTPFYLFVSLMAVIFNYSNVLFLRHSSLPDISWPSQPQIWCPFRDQRSG